MQRKKDVEPLLHDQEFERTGRANQKVKVVRKKYGLVIVGDYIRWTWVKFLRYKDESYFVCNIFCTQVQNEKDLKI